MNKRKTHKGLQKRMKVSASGKVMRRKSFKGHLMSGKSGTRCQKLRKSIALRGAFNLRALRALAAD